MASHVMLSYLVCCLKCFLRQPNNTKHVEYLFLFIFIFFPTYEVSSRKVLGVNRLVLSLLIDLFICFIFIYSCYYSFLCCLEVNSLLHSCSYLCILFYLFFSNLFIFSSIIFIKLLICFFLSIYCFLCAHRCFLVYKDKIKVCYS